VIVRILGEGQLDLPDDRLDDLNSLDDRLVTAIDTGDEDGFAASLGSLLDAVRSAGTPLPEDYLGPSELVLPGPGATVGEVRDLLTDEGLIPG
jgi:hypothetical protein